MVLTTVGQLKKELEKYPDDMPIQGYDGSDRPCPISVYVCKYEDVEVPPKPPPTLIVSVD